MRISCKMATGTIIDNFSKAKRLAGKPKSCLELVSHVMHVPLPPEYLFDAKNAILTLLRDELEIFSPELHGVPVAFNEKSIKSTEKYGVFIAAQPYVHCDVKCEFVVFKPKLGDILNGVVNKCTDTVIGCLIHGRFYATIHRKKANLNKVNINIGDKISLRVIKLEEDGNGLLSITAAFGDARKQKHAKEHVGDVIEEVATSFTGVDSGIENLESEVGASGTGSYDHLDNAGTGNSKSPTILTEEKHQSDSMLSPLQKKKEASRMYYKNPAQFEAATQPTKTNLSLKTDVNNNEKSVEKVKKSKKKKSVKKEKRKKKSKKKSDGEVNGGAISSLEDVKKNKLDAVIERQLTTLAQNEANLQVWLKSTEKEDISMAKSIEYDHPLLSTATSSIQSGAVAASPAKMLKVTAKTKKVSKQKKSTKKKGNKDAKNTISQQNLPDVINSSSQQVSGQESHLPENVPQSDDSVFLCPSTASDSTTITSPNRKKSDKQLKRKKKKKTDVVADTLKARKKRAVGIGFSPPPIKRVRQEQLQSRLNSSAPTSLQSQPEQKVDAQEHQRMILYHLQQLGISLPAGALNPLIASGTSAVQSNVSELMSPIPELKKVTENTKQLEKGVQKPKKRASAALKWIPLETSTPLVKEPQAFSMLPDNSDETLQKIMETEPIPAAQNQVSEAAKSKPSSESLPTQTINIKPMSSEEEFLKPSLPISLNKSLNISSSDGSSKRKKHKKGKKHKKSKKSKTSNKTM